MRAGRLIVKVAQGLLIFIKARAMATYDAMYYARERAVYGERRAKVRFQLALFQGERRER